MALPLSEDFARWREDPVTRLVFRALEKAEAEQKARWDAAAWGGGVVRAPNLEALLRELRVRADAYRAIRELTIDDLAAWLEIDAYAE